jgi:hypothetical protein
MAGFVNRSHSGALALLLAITACSGANSQPGGASAGGGAGLSAAGANAGGDRSTGGASSAGGANAAGGTLSAAGASAGSSAGGGSAGGAGLPPGVSPPKSPTASWVSVNGFRVLVGKRGSDGSLATPTPYEVRGVSWSPTGIGESNAGGYAKLYIAHGATDVPLIHDLHANTVKTYDPFERSAAGLMLLDQLYAAGVMVIMTVMVTHNTSQAEYTSSVNYFKDHPAILGWMVGNEFNYNKLYGAADLDTAIGLVNTAVTAIHAADPDHPVFVSHGEMPSADTYARLPSVDVWSINLYPNLDLTSRFTTWGKLSNKPMLVGEYGADAFDNHQMAEDQAMQASATQALTTEIMQHYSAIANDAAHPVLGGTIYELCDEWWKDAGGSASTHDNGGFSNAIYSDGFANEEWWGIATIERVPRKAYATLAALYGAP